MLRNLKSFNPSEIEEKILQFWKEKNIFEKTLIPKKGKKKKLFNFWEGPPTANGRPGIHHVIARSFKDVVLRYKTMAGFTVPRRGGWDTHGLPVELQTEKQLGLASKKDIEKYGVAQFNQKCKESVWIYKSEWEKFTERIAYWLDLKNAYVTYKNRYIETLWWIISQFWKKGLMYQGYKIVNWCTRCGTSLSSHEVAQGYKEVTENSVYIKFKLNKGQKIKNIATDDKTFVLSWTTTPWTLPGNVALAVGEKINYSLVEDSQTKEKYIIASELKNSVLKGENLKDLVNFTGKDLMGLSYKPLFDIATLKSNTSYKIYPADFVTTTDGTGVVHTAVVYGEDDYNLGKKIGLPEVHTVDENGKFVSQVKDLSGLYVKSKEAEEKIFEHLKNNGNFVSILPYTHEYPFCWRCDSPLLYYARSAWFVAVNKVKKQLIENNQKINWVPSHIKDGRFGEWLKEVKDWNFSRERYWGTPLPIWKCDKCDNHRIIENFNQLTELLPKSSNSYILMRHGQSQGNVKGISNGNPKDRNKFSLTLKGNVEAQKSAQAIKKNGGVDIIISSDFQRTAQTAKVVAEVLGVKKVIFDKRLREINVGVFDNSPINNYHLFFSSYEEKFLKNPPKGESLRDVAARVYSLIKEIEKKYKNKKILIVSHEYTLWMASGVINGYDQDEMIREKEKRGDDYLGTAQWEKINFKNVPRDKEGFCDYHKPHIDAVSFPCDKCKGKMTRVKEVADVWFDAGSMPFAQDHFPFNKNITFPADYISEAVDQTRGWFYTLLAVSTLLGLKGCYKNVICLGHIRDKNGQKMSKSRGNVIDPWLMINKYGADALRWYLFNVNAPGEPKNFDEEELAKTLRKTILVIYNSFVFLETYGKKGVDIGLALKSPNVLDKWIVERVFQLSDSVRKNMDAYDIIKSGQNIEQFIDDLSRWYIRRSRRRLQKPEEKLSNKNNDYQNASATLAYALLSLSKIMAPFVPFFSEALYQSLKKETKFDSKESVHLEEWPNLGERGKGKGESKNLTEEMEEIRKIASLVLAKRSELGIKVRQPLALLRVKGAWFRGKGDEGLLEILKDEVNVKEVIVDKKLKNEFELDTNITSELKNEGMIRELTRIIQDLRQKSGCVPKNKIFIWIESVPEIENFVKINTKVISLEVGAKKIEFGKKDKFDAEEETKIDGQKIWVGIKKA
ncbi:MAG: class I tRNA ligase family protein [Candidatus Paceibacterota bacterium]|jgi:isoleucyl-tRNA synthetase